MNGDPDALAIDLSCLDEQLAEAEREHAARALADLSPTARLLLDRARETLMRGFPIPEPGEGSSR